MADIVFPGQSSNTINSTHLPVNYDLVIYRGDNVEIFVTVNNADGTPIDESSALAEAVLKTDYNARAQVAFECSPGELPGEIVIRMPSITTSKLLPGSYIWDFQVSVEGFNHTYIAGDVTVYADVSTTVFYDPGAA